MQTRNAFSWIKEEITRSISVFLMIYIITRAPISNAYPKFSQQGYENPREATGRIVCANCQVIRGRGRPRKTIRETIRKDLEVNELDPNMIYDRTL